MLLSVPRDHGRRKRGVCRGSDTPTIYVGDIDMYIPRRKTQYLAMQTVCNTHWDAGKGNLTAQNTRKPFGGRGSTPDPTEGAYSAPTNPLAGRDALAVPFPRTPSPVLSLLGLASLTPTPKLVLMPLQGTDDNVYALLFSILAHNVRVIW